MTVLAFNSPSPDPAVGGTAGELNRMGPPTKLGSLIFCERGTATTRCFCSAARQEARNRAAAAARAPQQPRQQLAPPRPNPLRGPRPQVGC